MSDSVQSNSALGWLADPLAPTADGVQRSYRFTADRRWFLAPTAIGIALIAISLVGFLEDPSQFYFSYLIGWVSCLAIAVGGLFFLFFQHLTKAAWSVVVRRINESLVWAFPLLMVLGIPILFGMHDLYHWTHAELYVEGGPKYDEILAGKRSYLNTPFWIARVVVYFLLWTYLSHRLYALSVQMDVEGPGSVGDGIPSKLRTVSAWGLPLASVATAFASYDLLMSVDPHWFSTIFGVYFFSGGILAAVSLIAVLAATMQRTGGMLDGVVSREHYHDLGKFMFGFTVFWAYIAFSQYMLIWYAGIPEETIFYQHRLEHGWGWHSAALLGFHFILPFVVLLPRFTKRSLPVLSTMAVWLIVMHWFDMHWIVAPVQDGYNTLHWLDLTLGLGLFLVFLGTIVYRLSRHSLVPRQDPYLADSLHFENV
jgi:hypothetical protein